MIAGASEAGGGTSQEVRVAEHTAEVRARGRQIIDALEGERLLLAVECLINIENVDRHAAEIEAAWASVRLAERELLERESAVLCAAEGSPVAPLDPELEPETSPETPRAKYLTRVDLVPKP